MNIGVVIRLSDDPAQGGTPSYQRIRERALAAEAAGFDTIWLYDHLIYRHQGEAEAGTWECWTMLSALAEATSHVELGTIVMCVPFRNPALLAKMAETLDEVSNGRLILGLGAGWHEPEFSAFGIPFDHLGSRFADGIEIIAPLLREGRADYHGQYAEVTNGAILPRGPRQDRGGIPILIGGRGPRMLRLTAKFADAWNTAWLGEPAQLPERRATLDAACAEVGRDPATLATTVGVSIAFPDLMELPEGLAEHPERYLSGTPDELAASFRAFEEQGVTHLICAMFVSDSDPIFDRLTAGLHAYRAM